MKKAFSILLLSLLAVSLLCGCKPATDDGLGETDAGTSGGIWDWSTPLTQAAGNSTSGIYEKFLALEEGSTLEAMSAIMGSEPVLDDSKDYLDSYYGTGQFGIDKDTLIAQNLEYYAWTYGDSYELVEIAVGANGLYLKSYNLLQFSEDLKQATSDISAAYQSLTVGASLEDSIQTLGSGLTMSLNRDLRGPNVSFHSMSYSDRPFGDREGPYLALDFLNGALAQKSISYFVALSNNQPLTQAQLDAVESGMKLADVQAALGQDGFLYSESATAGHAMVTYLFGLGEDGSAQASASFYDDVLLTWEVY